MDLLDVEATCNVKEHSPGFYFGTDSVKTIVFFFLYVTNQHRNQPQNRQEKLEGRENAIRL